MERETQKDPMYIILSFDGGGVRMVLQYHIIKRILAKFPTLLDKITLFTGTSAGSMLAAGFATEILDTKKDNFVNDVNIKRIFERKLDQKITSVGGMTKSKYSNDNLEDLLDDIFGKICLSDMKKAIMIPAFKLEGEVTPKTDLEKPSWLKNRIPRWHPIYYNNFQMGTVREYHPNKSLKDIIMESTAAPCYFPIINGVVDGGIGNTNPSLSAISKLLEKGIKLENIYVLSIGSGERANSIDVTDDEWGLIKWAPYLLDMISDADQDVSSNACYHILKDRFWRVQPILNETISLDDTTKYDKLIDIAHSFDLTNTYIWIKNLLYNIKN